MTASAPATCAGEDFPRCQRALQGGHRRLASRGDEVPDAAKRDDKLGTGLDRRCDVGCMQQASKPEHEPDAAQLAEGFVDVRRRQRQLDDPHAPAPAARAVKTASSASPQRTTGTTRWAAIATIELMQPLGERLDLGTGRI